MNPEIEPRNLNGAAPGVIMEIEVVKSEGRMEEAAQVALAQIEEKRCDAKLREAGVEKIDKYAVVFCGKKVRVLKNRE